ncbi:MAG: hypothetical protein JNM44_00780 [Chitinophagaceae bacterium]|nr:hypothetical protein [Chitinophagaceae bacterium]
MMRYYLILIVLGLFPPSMLGTNRTKISLNGNWEFKQMGQSHWLPAQVPGCVHLDLLRNKKIPDPFFRDNETKLFWISEKIWEYQKVFYLPSNWQIGQTKRIVFEGIDTYAGIYLNGEFLGEADNMFRSWEFKTNRLKAGRNIIRVVFQSPVQVSDSLARNASIRRPCENNRHYSRKAQYHFGWDWAPRLPTSGIWRSVYIANNEDRIYPSARYAPVKLIQEKDSIGESFYFTVEGKPVFMRGANWIPGDVFLPRMTPARYRQLLIAAKQANINMLRVWGGGIYEEDIFYDLCDSLGIYVWQDFMFAGAMYPADSGFIQSIREEVTQNILRLRKHPCIVLWCGNNEIDEAWHNWGWQNQFQLSASDTAFLWREYRQIFHELLPDLVNQFDPQRNYITTSPQIGWGRKESMTQGDSHYWGLWWGLQPITVLKEKVPRFMSEYGMQAMPNWSSILKYSIPADWDTSSLVMKVHQKHPTGYSTLANYLQQENLQVKNFKEFIVATQEIQHRVIKTAVEAQINSKGRCMGSLFWQFNDCWPVCSWSVVDYYGGRKKGYYTMQNAYKQAAK